MKPGLWLECVCCFLLSIASMDAMAQSKQPYPNATTDRLFRAKTPMAPPPVNTVFADPDFGSSMVRVTDQNTNPKVAGSYFYNSGTETSSWSADGKKFYIVGQNAVDLAFGFDPFDYNENQLQRELWSVTRIALRNWLKNPPGS